MKRTSLLLLLMALSITGCGAQATTATTEESTETISGDVIDKYEPDVERADMTNVDKLATDSIFNYFAEEDVIPSEQLPQDMSIISYQDEELFDTPLPIHLNNVLAIYDKHLNQIGTTVADNTYLFTGATSDYVHLANYDGDLVWVIKADIPKYDEIVENATKHSLEIELTEAPALSGNGVTTETSTVVFKAGTYMFSLPYADGRQTGEICPLYNGMEQNRIVLTTTNPSITMTFDSDTQVRISPSVYYERIN